MSVFSSFYRHSGNRYSSCAGGTKRRAVVATVSFLKETTSQLPPPISLIFATSSSAQHTEVAHHHFNEKVLRDNRELFPNSFRIPMANTEKEEKLYGNPDNLGSNISGSTLNSIYNPTTTFKIPHQKLLQAIQYIPRNMQALEELHEREGEDYEQDVAAARLHSGLYLRQIKLEEEQHLEAMYAYLESVKQLVGMGRGTSMKFVQRVLLSWFDPLHEAILSEIEKVKSKEKGIDRSLYGPAFLLLPVDKLAAITLQSLVAAAIASPNGVSFPPLAMDVGKRIEAEINVIKFTKGKKGLKNWEQEIVQKCSGSKPYQAWNKLRSLLNEDSWPDSTRVKIGSALLFLAVKNAMLEDGRPAFLHRNFYSPFLGKRVGLLEVDPDVIVKISNTSTIFGSPPYYPMLVKPKPWNNHKNDGGYFRLRPGIMRTKSKSQLSAVKKADIPEILEALNYLGEVPWRVNSRVLDTIKKLWDSGDVVGEIPSKADIPLPTYEQVIVALNSKKATEKKEDKVDQEPVNLDNSEKDVSANVVMNLPWEKEYTKMSKRVKMKNADLHSLRCDLQLKLSIAEKFREETFYFPSNLDFRGRSYPVPPNFSHLGSDLCRGLLLFDTAKPLGDNGLNWLKIHLSNLFGNNKITLEERIEWADIHLDDIRDSALRPFDGQRWWATAEEPFQALATCFEITDAINSGDPAKFMSRLPIHQDGSCNGLQHYAALGRDHPGAIAVSLVPGEKPGDVYSAVLSIVLSKIDADAAYPDDPPDVVFDESESEENTKRKSRDFARLLKGHVNRKVIKQTVMTSVYGVTSLGARNQVRARLMEAFFPNSNELNDEEKETKVYWAAGYLADLTLQSLGEMFSSANQIMDWLGTCALLVAKVNQPISWVTPLGLPVIQPYRKSSSYKIKTLLQTITLALDDDSLPVQVRKQRSAFPPNFVHSLDATHMLMTALRAKKSGISFAAVHDSYWTHAIDVPLMSSMLRETFVELYTLPILEDLRGSLCLRYPHINFPPIPERGSLNINLVSKSKYFFH